MSNYNKMDLLTKIKRKIIEVTEEIERKGFCDADEILHFIDEVIDDTQQIIEEQKTKSEQNKSTCVHDEYRKHEISQSGFINSGGVHSPPSFLEEAKCTINFNRMRLW